MNHYKVSASSEFPEVNLNHENGKLSISGKSYMEDAISFYEPILAWLKAYNNQPASKTEFTFALEYMNTSSSKYILDIFDLLNQIHIKGHIVEVIWQYYKEDEDMEDQGRQYAELFNLPFRFEMKDS